MDKEIIEAFFFMISKSAHSSWGRGEISLIILDFYKDTLVLFDYFSAVNLIIGKQEN